MALTRRRLLERCSARHRLAVAGAMPHGATGREADGSGPTCFGDDARHLANVVGGGRFVTRATIAHDVAAHGTVRNVGRHVDCVIARGE